jgi:preprotein translocase subunit YajC
VTTLAFLQQVPPKGAAPAAADPGTTSAPGGAPQQAPPPGGGLFMLLPLLIFLPFIFLSFRRQKKEQEARSALKKGDRVVSNSGLVGELVEVDERFAKVKIAPGTTVQMLAQSVSPLEADQKKDTAKQLEDLKDAKAEGKK